jgi:imidazoleglycerol phosphate synthase glutamine amidotransferase subunit HisH
MGWNTVRWLTPGIQTETLSFDNAQPALNPAIGATIKQSPKLATIPSNQQSSPDSFYFVHSYHAQTPDRSLVWGETDYGYPFVSAIRRGNCFATQFHPEKSQAKGLQLYRNFLDTAAAHRATRAP